MGMIRGIGKFAGKVAGGLIGGTVSLVGDVVGSEVLQDAGKMACAITSHTGDTLGRLAEGAFTCVGGVITNDKEKMEKGASEVFGTAKETVTNMGKGVVRTAELGLEGIDGILNGDVEKTVKVGKTFVKIGIASLFSYGILDVIDGCPDGHILDFDHDGVPDFLEKGAETVVENPNMHHVEPHWRNYSNGTKTWVDGDGIASEISHEGWFQHNPDYRII